MTEYGLLTPEALTLATQLVNQQADRLTGEGLDSVPTIGRSFYDSMLDTSALLGALPARVADIDDHGNDGLPAFVDRLFAAARGTAELPASAMTKWFDTNYHYIVPELAADTEFRLDDAALLARLHRARPERVPRRLDVVRDPVVDRLVVRGRVLDVLVHLRRVVRLRGGVPRAHVDAHRQPVREQPLRGLQVDVASGCWGVRVEARVVRGQLAAECCSER